MKSKNRKAVVLSFTKNKIANLKSEKVSAYKIFEAHSVLSTIKIETPLACQLPKYLRDATKYVYVKLTHRDSDFGT